MSIVDDVVQEIFDELYNNGQRDHIDDEDTEKWDEAIKQEVDYVVNSAKESYVESLVIHYASFHPGWLTDQLEETSSLRSILHKLLSEEIERCRIH
jgi:hypothetical protein